MGVGPCEWSEVKTNAATKEGFLMNTLRRISRPLVKTFAVGAVMVAAALPAMAIAGTASAATTAPTIACTVAATTGTPSCSSGYAIIGQGMTGTFVLEGTGLAFDQAVGGNVTLTTTAPGVTFTDVNETSATTLSADIDSTSATTPGFYPVTLTDDNGTVTDAVGLGVDNGPQVSAIAGNAGTVGAAASTVSVTGTFLNNSVVSIVPVTGSSAPTLVVGSTVLSASGTTLAFNVAQPTGTTPGAYTVLITSTWPTGAVGVASTSYTVNAAATAISITGVTPNELGIPTVNPSTQTVTVSGTGFELGAILTIAPETASADVSIADPVFENSTTMSAQITVDPGAALNYLDVTVRNPDTTTVTGDGLIGIGQPAKSTAAGPSAPTAPALGAVNGYLAPGTASIIQVAGTSTFPITTGSTVGVKQAGVTNVSESLVGTVVSVDATNNATIRVEVPRYATSTTTAAIAAGATTFSVADATGIHSPGTLTIVDGASTEALAYTLSGNAVTITTAGGAAFAHLAGVTVEFPFPAGTPPTGVANVLSVNNGTNTETATVPIDEVNPIPGGYTYPAHSYTATGTGATLATLDPGTYSINAYLPGFEFAAGAAVTFQSFTTGGVADNDGVTGTVTVVNGNTATLNVTVPKIRSGATGDHLTVSASPGQSAITLNSVVNSSVAGNPNILVGDSITINADSFYTTPETVTVTSVNTSTDVVGITPALADNHTGGALNVGATVTDNSDPQSINDRVQATITNAATPTMVEVDPSFFSFSTGGTITGTELATANTTAGDPGVTPFGALNTVGAGASGATINLALSQNTDGSAPADWTGSSTNAGVTFGPITNDTGMNITTTINVAPGTAANASVPISFTDGLETYAGTIAIVAGPTVSAVTAVGVLTAGNAFTIGVTGTNFVVGEMSCSTSDPAVVCTVDPESTDSSTTATVTLTAAPAMVNGSDSLTLTYSNGAAATYGAGTLAGAFTVSGQPTVTAITPTVVPAGTDPALAITGTLFPTSGTSCGWTATDPTGATTTGGCTVAFSSATAGSITGYSTGIDAGDTVVFTVGSTTATANTPAVTIQADPVSTYIVTSSVLSGFTKTVPAETIAVGSTAVPFHIVGAGFLAGATVTLASDTSGTAGTATVTSVTPNGIFGTISVPAGATVGGESATVTNANGGSTTFADLFTIAAAPSITTPSTGTPKAILDGTATTVTITGHGFIAGAVVSGAVAGVDTFGPAVVSESGSTTDKCTGVAGDVCDTITVPVTPVSFSGSTPILDGLVVTNPVGGGAVTVQGDITVNPVPAVTGVYYVPTFTSNAEITINGTGFETGITASSANPDYTVLAVASTPTTVTLLVTTDSNATSGTSSTITLTNPDGGSGTFPLNGGPNPNTVTPTPKATRTVGVVHTGKTSVVRVVGTHFYGQPHVTSNDKGTTVRVTGDTGKILTLRVSTLKTTKKGVHTFIIRFANGEQTSVKYNDTK
jgi:hypothetical protein